MLAAHDDKRNPGAGIASPTMPWAWGRLTVDKKDKRSAPYHLVWPRDLYQVATAEIAAGAVDAANAKLDFLLDKAQRADGHFPQNVQVDRPPEVDRHPDGRAGVPDRARLAARALRRRDLAQAAADGRVHPPPRPGDRAGPLGEPERLLAGDDRRRDRRARLRRRPGAPQRRDGRRRRATSGSPTAGPAPSSAGRRPPTARTPTSRTTCGSPRTAGRTAARATASATAGPRGPTSARSSTRASSSSCGSASSGSTTR